MNSQQSVKAASNSYPRQELDKQNHSLSARMHTATNKTLTIRGNICTLTSAPNRVKMCCCVSCVRPCTALRTSHQWTTLTACPPSLPKEGEEGVSPSQPRHNWDGFWHSKYERVLAAVLSSGTPAYAHGHTHTHTMNFERRPSTNDAILNKMTRFD